MKNIVEHLDYGNGIDIQSKNDFIIGLCNLKGSGKNNNRTHNKGTRL